VGHHVSYPATLATEARLRTLERALIPWREYSLVNMFTDMLINEHLGGALSGEFVRVYRALIGDVDWRADPAFLFTLSAYECLWRLPPGAILGRHAEPFFEAYPAHRADAELLAQDLFPLAPTPLHPVPLLRLRGVALPPAARGGHPRPHDRAAVRPRRRLARRPRRRPHPLRRRARGH